MKQVQISEDLFLSLIKYHILEYYNEEEKIAEGLQHSLQFSMVGFFLVYLKQKRDTFLFFSWQRGIAFLNIKSSSLEQIYITGIRKCCMYNVFRNKYKQKY